MDQSSPRSINQLPVATDAKEARASLLKEMKRTKGSRFNASMRLEERSRKRTRNTAYASASVVCLTLIPSFFEVFDLVEKAISLTTIALSIFILASSLLQSADADPVKADQFQRCALEINSLRREFRSHPDPSQKTIQEYSVKFDGILQRYNINHEEVDYEKYRLDHPDEFLDFPQPETEQARKDVKSTHDVFDRYASLIIIPTVLLMVLSTTKPLIGLFEKVGELFRSVLGAG
ncbi:SLATT domain-containing protein [Ochrobactrum sp. C6C9]|nr:SLATT domain-containing protein [Ochrobactrum sp. C6C9]